jgi:hypothetical protein
MKNDRIDDPIFGPLIEMRRLIPDEFEVPGVFPLDWRIGLLRHEQRSKEQYGGWNHIRIVKETRSDVRSGPIRNKKLWLRPLRSLGDELRTGHAFQLVGLLGRQDFSKLNIEGFLILAHGFRGGFSLDFLIADFFADGPVGLSLLFDKRVDLRLLIGRDSEFFLHGGIEKDSVAIELNANLLYAKKLLRSENLCDGFLLLGLAGCHGLFHRGSVRLATAALHLLKRRAHFFLLRFSELLELRILICRQLDVLFHVFSVEKLQDSASLTSAHAAAALAPAAALAALGKNEGCAGHKRTNDDCLCSGYFHFFPELIGTRERPKTTLGFHWRRRRRRRFVHRVVGVQRVESEVAHEGGIDGDPDPFCIFPSNLSWLAGLNPRTRIDGNFTGQFS